MFTRSALLAALVLLGCPRDDTTSPVPPAPDNSITTVEQVEPSVRATNSEATDTSEVIVIEEEAPAPERQAREKPITQRRSTPQPQTTEPQPEQTETTDPTTDTTKSTDDPIGTDALNQGIGGGDTYDRNR